HHFEAGNVGVESLDGLRVVEGAVYAGTERGPDHHRAGPPAVGAVVDAGHLGDYLVEGGMDVVRELDLGQRTQAAGRHSHGHADDRRLRQGAVEATVRAEPLRELFGGLEHAPL